MPRALRSEQFDPAAVCIVHCVQRCVRRAYLAGVDVVSGRNYEFRKEWIRVRMERLASVFGIDVLTYAILSNHMHLVIRTRPDVVSSWSDEQVALRWLRVFPGRRLDEQLAEPVDTDVKALANDSKRIQLIRARISDPSWFMRALSEPIARLANKQDECTGSFWEGRFKAQAITDEAGLLACSMYVDLNPIRAAMAATPEESVHTSAYDRIQSLNGVMINSAAAELTTITRDEATKELLSMPIAERIEKRGKANKGTGLRVLRDAWLAPLTLNERASGKPLPSNSGTRASDRGFLSLNLRDYLDLLDWTGKQRGAGKSGTVPKELAPILQRIGIEGSMWCDLVWSFKKYFGRSSAAGSPQSLRSAAKQNGRHFTRGQRSVKGCFIS